MKTKGVYRLFYTSVFLFSVTGIIYGIYKYFFQIEGEYGWRPHPWQGFWHESHLFTSVASLIVLGILAQAHVLPKILKGEKKSRSSGIGLIVLFALMISTGFALQTGTAPLWIELNQWAHGVASLLFLILGPWHFLKA